MARAEPPSTRPPRLPQAPRDAIPLMRFRQASEEQYPRRPPTATAQSHCPVYEVVATPRPKLAAAWYKDTYGVLHP